MVKEKTEFGKKIERLAFETGTNFADLAEKMGIDRRNIHRFLKVKNPTPRTVFKLAKIFNKPVDFFLEEGRLG